MKNNIIIIDNLTKNLDYKISDGQKKIFVILLTDTIDQIGEIKVNIIGMGVDVKILGIVIGCGEQKIKLYSLQNHLNKESVSDLLIKSVLFDRAKFSYHGLIKIAKGAQKSVAYQRNNNILMSNDTWVKSRPYLEILANDVHCKHGVVVGKIDKDQLYYLLTRGLSEKAAQILLIKGFLGEVVDRIPDEKLQKEIAEKIDSIIDKLLERRSN